MDNKLKIINYLGKNWEKNPTMHELGRLLSIPYASFYRTVQRMKDVLIIEKVGKAKMLKLNRKNPIVKAYLTIASDEERKVYLKKQPVVRKIAMELETNDVVILFGSYAKGKETEKSDIDILVINKEGRKSLSFSKYELLYKKKINPIFVTKKEFKNMLKDKEENVGKQVLKEHIILNNPEEFWECVFRAI
jgi:predicted nucleotidyltransferase